MTYQLITKDEFILSSFSSGLDFWNLEFLELFRTMLHFINTLNGMFFKKTSFAGEISSNCLNDFLE